MKFVVASAFLDVTNRDDLKLYDSAQGAIDELVGIIDAERRERTPKSLYALTEGEAVSCRESVLSWSVRPENVRAEILAWLTAMVAASNPIHFTSGIEAQPGYDSEYWLVRCEHDDRFVLPDVILIGDTSDAPWVTVLDASTEFADRFDWWESECDYPPGEKPDDPDFTELFYGFCRDHPSVPVWKDRERSAISRASLDELSRRCAVR